MPRQQKRIPRKTFKRKCHNCGKMATDPLVFHVVPSYSYGEEIPVYQKNAPKTDRIDLKGDRKVAVYNYCDRKCMDTHKGRFKV